MKLKKYMAFTVAELMILLSIMVVLLAAFAPIFTVRYNNASAENVWFFVGNDDNANAYSDPISKVLTAQSFIGLTPANKSDVLRALRNSNNETLYSKLTIRPTHMTFGANGERQKQIQFRYGNKLGGSVAGTLFADGTNILFGGNYVDIKTRAQNNTSFGSATLNNITEGSSNSALGYASLQSLNTGSRNTAIGYKAASNLTTGNSNTIIGNSASSSLSRGTYNTVIGSYAQSSVEGYANTIVGYLAGASLKGSSYKNTAVGYKALYNVNGNANTAIGPYAMSLAKLSYPSYNTAVGYNACSGVTGSNKTCIGANSGVSTVKGLNKFLLTDSYERVYIGSKPVEDVGGAAVLEVHNMPTSNSASMPRKNAGDSTVVVNGNLVVRGQSYISVAWTAAGGPGLVGFKVTHAKDGSDMYGFGGWDGNYRNTTTDEECGGKCQGHAEDRGRKNCVCAFGPEAGIKSYDWTTETTTAHSCMSPSNRVANGVSYTDGSGYGKVEIDRNFLTEAHPLNGKGNSCCPNLKSDIRLKNVGAPFIAGLDEINKLKIYNYTYKNDSDKIPHVGVIAQDLKQILPTAVTKDKNGYYQIRWDEMFYAAINAIKTLNSKVEALANRISNDRRRIAALKQDNAAMEKKLVSLEQELSLLEKKHK